jgi:hypothetical protein
MLVAITISATSNLIRQVTRREDYTDPLLPFGVLMTFTLLRYNRPPLQSFILFATSVETRAFGLSLPLQRQTNAKHSGKTIASAVFN